MKNRRTLLFIAAFLTFITFVGHTIGHFTMPAADDTPAQEALKVMDATSIAMPVGAPKSLHMLHDGSNLCLSVYLLLAAVLLFLLARQPSSPFSKSVQRAVSVSLVAVAVLSFVYFFPVPALCTGIAGVVGLLTS